ncbi:MAG: hypothetical protein KF819_25695 [Labilithrix sp.]|nr:hypothetical protein [Labilithrix sp.]
MHGLLSAARAARRAGDEGAAFAAIRQGERELVAAIAELGRGEALVERHLFETYAQAARAMTEARGDDMSRGVDVAAGLLAPLASLSDRPSCRS